MEVTIASSYWCHMCTQTVNPIPESEIKCPICQSGFIEEMNREEIQNPEIDLGTDRALSLWAPILLGMMSIPRRRRRFESNNVATDSDNDFDRELESILRRRRRSSAIILQLLQGIRSEISSDNGPNGLNGNNQGHNGNNGYLIGQRLDLLLESLSETDSSQGIEPACKEVVKALPTVKITEPVQCSICLDEFEIGNEGKEMPCKHKFHKRCIVQWLELHSSCPVCRFKLPSDDEMKIGNERSVRTRDDSDGDDVVEGRSGRRFWFSWPFSGLFSSSGSRSRENSFNSRSSG